jgi:hypothetical protein
LRLESRDEFREVTRTSLGEGQGVGLVGLGRSAMYSLG